MMSKLFAALCGVGLLATLAGCGRGEKAKVEPAQEVECGQVVREEEQTQGEQTEAVDHENEMPSAEEPKTPGY